MGFVLGYVAAQARLVRRERSALFWVIAFPFMMVLISSSLWGRPAVPKIDVAVLNLDGNTSIVNGLIKGLEGAPVVKRVILVDNMSALREKLQGSVGLIIPGGFTENITSGRRAVLVVAYPATGEPWVNTSVSILVGVLGGFEDRMRSRLLQASLPYVPEEYRGYLVAIVDPLRVRLEPVQPRHPVTASMVRGWMVVSMIIVESLFVGLNVGATSFHEERRTGLLGYILSSPVRGWQLLAARLLTAVMYVGFASIAAAAAGAMVGAGYTVTAPGLAVAAVMVALATLLSTSLGLVVSGLVKREDAAQAVATAIAFPLMFLGGIWIPPWMLPPPLQRLAQVFPVSSMAEAARAVLVYGKPPLQALREYTPPQVVALSLALIALGVLVYRRMLERIIETP